MTSKRIAFKVHGTVQGVGFRHGLTGWVRNTTCGRVEGEVQGDEQTVQKLLQQIDKGPRHAHVVKLEKRDLELQDGEDQFLVMRTAESMFHSGA